MSNAGYYKWWQTECREGHFNLSFSLKMNYFWQNFYISLFSMAKNDQIRSKWRVKIRHSVNISAKKLFCTYSSDIFSCLLWFFGFLWILCSFHTINQYCSNYSVLMIHNLSRKNHSRFLVQSSPGSVTFGICNSISESEILTHIN